MAGEVKLPRICIPGSVACNVLKELRRGGEAEFRAALKVRLPQGKLNMVARRAAASVAVTEGNDEFIKVFLLRALIPLVDQGRRSGRGIVIRMQEYLDLAAVMPAPHEVVVRERLSAVIVPEDLACGEMAHAAAFHDFRQRRRVAEHIRQPGDLTVNAEFFLEIPLAEQELADQRLAARDVRIRFDPHRAVRDPLSGLDLFADTLEERGIILFRQFVKGRFALEEPVFRITVHVAQLRGNSAQAFALGLHLRPEPAHVDMRVAKAIEYGRSAAVFAGKRGRERFTRTAEALKAMLHVRLKINRAREIFERLCDLGRAQAVLVETAEQVAQERGVEIERVCVLMPDAKGV